MADLAQRRCGADYSLNIPLQHAEPVLQAPLLQNTAAVYFYNFTIYQTNTIPFMKKMMLGALALIGVCSMANANQLTINNNTGCTYDLSIGGIGNTSNPMIAVPGTSTYNSSAPSTGIFGVKVMYVDVLGGQSQISVGNGSPYANSLSLPTPTCTSAVGYLTAVWQNLPNGDVVLTLL